MRGNAIILVVVVGMVPIIVFGLLAGVPSLGLVKWEPPVVWTAEFGSPSRYAILQGSGVTAISADQTGLYTAGFFGRVLPYVNATTSYLFLNKYDFNGHEIWSQHVAENSYISDVKAMSVGADGVYVAGTLNGSIGPQDGVAFVQKHDLNGSTVWTSKFGSLGEEATSVSVGATGVYVSGSNATDYGFVRDYDFNGNVAWTHTVSNISTGSFHVYAGSTGVYVIGPTLVSKYDFTGGVVWASQFPCYCSVTGISGDSSGIYVSGYTHTALSGLYLNSFSDAFVRKYDPNGDTLWTIQFRMPDYSNSDSARISVSPSGIYLLVNTGGTQSFVMRYDGSGNRVWSVPVRASTYSMSVASSGVFVGGTVDSDGRAFVASFSQSSSLIFFGLGPPFSFLLAGLLGGVAVLSILWLRRRWRRKARPRKIALRFGKTGIKKNLDMQAQAGTRAEIATHADRSIVTGSSIPGTRTGGRNSLWPVPPGGDKACCQLSQFS